MRKIARRPWVYYLGDESHILERHKCGKWMYFFDDQEFAAEMCRQAVEENIVVRSKHSDADNGVSCFYLNGDDLEGHKKVIEFFLKNKLIKRTKAGNLHNISFKFDDQTRAYYSGKTVLVTGGGGSIGSELCRQIAKNHPEELVIFDIYEKK